MITKFYLNNYKWIEPILAIILACSIYYVLYSGNPKNSILIIQKILKANDSLFGAIASLLGFVFATITILVGLGDNFKSNENTNILTRIIERLSIEKPLEADEIKSIKNKHTASSLFFGTAAYSLTLRSLLGCVRILAIVSILSLVVSIISDANKCWATFVVFYLSFALLSIVRILILVKYLIHILTNSEKSRN